MISILKCLIFCFRWEEEYKESEEIEKEQKDKKVEETSLIKN